MEPKFCHCGIPLGYHAQGTPCTQKRSAWEMSRPKWIDDGPHPITPEVWKHLCDKVEQRAKEIVDEGARALEDFTARRKAKREKSPPIFTAEAMDKAIMALYAQPDPTPLARAMSTPLPHDPPMSARLMPWRGK